MEDYVLSVSALNAQIKSLLETTFLFVSVEGEISNFTKHTSGHIYFSIKDKKSTIRCVMFKGNATSLKFELESSQKVIVYGGLSVYTPRGEYQILCKNITPSGAGALALAYEQLKIKLTKKGYFETERKKAIPLFPKRIALLTSFSGAALQDMLRIANKRWNLVNITIINTLVQGDEAKYDIVQNLAYADSFYASKEAFDVIVIGRGGGSMEDLWAFNEEIVADAIFVSRTPVVSAVGHEVDFLISDFVADLRAPTPSACMEMILPDRSEWLLKLSEMMEFCTLRVQNLLEHKRLELEGIKNDFAQVSYETRLNRANKDILEVYGYLKVAFENLLSKKQALVKLDLFYPLECLLEVKSTQLKEIYLSLEAKNPQNFVQLGYAQILKNNNITPLFNLQEADEIELVDTKISLRAKILS